MNTTKRWPVDPDSAKANQVSSVDELIGRLPPGTRITIDIGRTPRFGLGCSVIVRVGYPDAVAREGGWLHGIFGEAWQSFSPANALGDHLFENALFDAWDAMSAGLRAKASGS